MNKLLLNRLFLVLLLLSFFKTNAQQKPGTLQGNGVISGRLLDAGTNQPLEFATVALVKKADNSPVKSIQTDLQGYFKLPDIPDGRYILRATYVGYATFFKDSIAITPARRTLNLGAIKMSQSKGILKEVSIRAQRSAIQLGTDKKVFSVDQSLVSMGGSATDLLSNVPSVQVDVDGNVNLRGSSNVRVLINGKPSAISGGNVSDILQSIPASSIENIEVITNPSSKYDAEGQSGIINIILKKNARLGFNGSASGTAGNQHTYNGTLNLAYQNKNVNLYGNYSYRKADRVGNGYTNKTTYDPINGPIFQNQIADQEFDINGHNVRAGVDINLDKKTTLSFSGNGNFRDRNRFQNGNTNITTSTGKLTQLINQNNSSASFGTRNLDFNTDFDRKYKKQGEELTANIGYSNGTDNSNDNQITTYNYYTVTPSRSYQHFQHILDQGNNHNLNIQADFTLPLSNNRKIETGYRSTFGQQNSNNDVDTLQAPNTHLIDYALNNHFVYNEQIHAVYGNYNQQFGKFGVQGGVRIEDTRINTLLKDNGERHNQDYFRVYPSIFLSDKLDENQTLQLSYTRRVARPRDQQISPFLDKSDPFNYRQGNPELKPEDTHSFELSYINYWKTLTLTSSVYYRLTHDNIQQLRIPVDTATTLLQYENIKTASNSGFELIAKVNATDKIDLTANVNVYYRYLAGEALYDLPTTSGYAWNANLTANFKPLPKLGIQLRGDYQAPQVITQGRQRAMAGMDGGIKYDLTKKLNLSLNSRDIFDSRKFGSIIDNNIGKLPYHSESVRRFSSRVVLFTVAYRFGSNPDQKKDKDKKKKDQQDPDAVNPDEGGAGGTGGGGTNGGNPPAGGGTPPGQKF